MNQSLLIFILLNLKMPYYSSFGCWRELAREGEVMQSKQIQFSQAINGKLLQLNYQIMWQIETIIRKSMCLSLHLKITIVWQLSGNAVKSIVIEISLRWECDDGIKVWNQSAQTLLLLLFPGWQANTSDCSRLLLWRLQSKVCDFMQGYMFKSSLREQEWF